MKNALYALVVFLFLSGVVGCRNFPGACNDSNCNNGKECSHTSSIFQNKKAYFTSSAENIDFIVVAGQDRLWFRDKTFPDNLFETNITLKQFTQALQQQENIRDTTIYKGIYSFNNKRYTGMVDFNGVEANGDINFIISIGTAKGCTSSLKGTAKLVEASKATYRDSVSGCNLAFEFNNNKLQIKENKCRMFHGASCSFEGKFDKE